jgi:ribonuclease BN (tRNA processing enzyme)
MISDRFSRRSVLALLAATPAFGAAGAAPALGQPADSLDAAAARARAALKDARGTKLVMLGTGGGPVAGRARRMTSHVLVSDGAAYVVDCGLGVTAQLARAGILFPALRSIFLTHHHPDHNVEYGPLLLLGWIAGMKADVHAYGPPPLRQMTEDYLRAYATTIGFWVEDLKIKPLGPVAVTEISAAGPVMQDDRVKVSAIVVQHPPVKPSLGYRFDFKDRSIAFSGDTAPLEALAEMARGADVLVHEAIDMSAMAADISRGLAAGEPGTLADYMAHMKADHTPAEEAGRIAQEAGVKTLVLSHLVPSEGVSDDTWRAAAAKHFGGEILVAHDLMVV